MSPFLIAYLVVMVGMLLVAGFLFIEASFKEKKYGSRMMLFAPVWPMLAPVFIFKGVRWLWKHADWRGIEEDEYEEKQKQKGHYGNRY